MGFHKTVTESQWWKSFKTSWVSLPICCQFQFRFTTFQCLGTLNFQELISLKLVIVTQRHRHNIGAAMTLSVPWTSIKQPGASTDLRDHWSYLDLGQILGNIDPTTILDASSRWLILLRFWTDCDASNIVDGTWGSLMLLRFWDWSSRSLILANLN